MVLQQIKQSRAAVVSAAITHLLAWAAFLWLALWPFSYQGISAAAVSVDGGGATMTEVARYSASLTEVNGYWVLLPLSAPVLATGLALLSLLTWKGKGGRAGNTLILVPSPADIGTSIRNELNSGHHTARMFPNMSASKYRVELTESQKRRLSEVAHRGKSPARTVKRALALLKADEGQIDNRIADALSISRRTVVRIRKRFCEEGLESALVERARPGQKRKLDERAEAHLVAIACSDPPEGHAHWTLKLLADKAVELGYVESIARETMRQSLKKTNLSRGRTRRGASRN